MAIKYRVLTREVLLGKDKGKRMQFAQSITTNKITFKRFCEEIADGSTVGSADVKAVLDRMVTVLRRHMQDGESVDCGELGTFTPTFGSSGVPEGEDFTAKASIRDPKISFRPKPAFKALTGVRFERISAEEEALRSAATAKKKGKKPNEGGGSGSASGGSSSTDTPDHAGL
ncbi:MAG: hypothetical protein Q4A61_01675 [Porphyromonadaceae bacterium]|nr:hypothetical protein [Porphyromonadaceae bacterium]